MNKLYIIAGPNGDGKTTIETSLIAEGNQNNLKIYDQTIWSELRGKYGKKV